MTKSIDIGEAGYETYATNSVGYGNYIGTDGNGDEFSSESEPTTCGASIQFRQKNIFKNFMFNYHKSLLLFMI